MQEWKEGWTEERDERKKRQKEGQTEGRRGTDGQEEDRDRGTGAVEAAVSGQHHHHHHGGCEAPRSPTATHGHHALVASCVPRELQSPACDTRPCRAPALPVMGATMMGATMAGPGTAVQGTANHRQWPQRVALVAMPQHGPRQTMTAASRPSTAPKGGGSGDVPGLGGPWGCVSSRASMPWSTRWDVHVATGVAAHVPGHVQGCHTKQQWGHVPALRVRCHASTPNSGKRFPPTSNHGPFPPSPPPSRRAWWHRDDTGPSWSDHAGPIRSQNAPGKSTTQAPPAAPATHPPWVRVPHPHPHQTPVDFGGVRGGDLAFEPQVTEGTHFRPLQHPPKPLNPPKINKRGRILAPPGHAGPTTGGGRGGVPQAAREGAGTPPS